MRKIKIAVFGRKKDTFRYEQFVQKLSCEALVTLDLEELYTCDALLLPGGGDITPAFFGQFCNGSRNIDTELDILQLKAMDYAKSRPLPVLGICKGLQLINVAFGGAIIQNLPTAERHCYRNADQYHNTYIQKDSLLYSLTGPEAIVNSAHHQGVGRIGRGLVPIQWCSDDHCIEALVHESLPILGVQWHPERIDNRYGSLSGTALLQLFLTQFTGTFS